MSTNTTTEKEREDQRGKSFESLFPKAEHFELQINSCSLKLLISYLQFNISYIAEESKHRFIFQAEASNILGLQRLKHEDLLCFLSVNWIIASFCARGKLRNGHSEHTWLNLLVLFTHRNRSIIFFVRLFDNSVTVVHEMVTKYNLQDSCRIPGSIPVRGYF